MACADVPLRTFTLTEQGRTVLFTFVSNSITDTIQSVKCIGIKSYCIKLL